MQETDVSLERRRPVTDTFIDEHGSEHRRCSSMDCQTLESRTVGAILDVNNLEQNHELHVIVSNACHLYASAAYPQALYHLDLALEKEPALEPYLFYYKRVCERVLAVALTPGEKAYEARCIRRRKLPAWLRRLCPVPILGRCKWCGRYTEYIAPNVGTCTYPEENSCRHCKRMYPMPCVIWDGPEGRAYSYYRMSHPGDEFYEEFEKDYDPDPLAQCRRA